MQKNHLPELTGGNIFCSELGKHNEHPEAPPVPRFEGRSAQTNEGVTFLDFNEVYELVI
jgi:hypothetical protein